ncbi:metallophosphoesterase [Burkholderia pseudomallei 576]|nr:metallophosphoesterase [Burkholderia pseudomallei 576]
MSRRQHPGGAHARRQDEWGYRGAAIAPRPEGSDERRAGRPFDAARQERHRTGVARKEKPGARGVERRRGDGCRRQTGADTARQAGGARVRVVVMGAAPAIVPMAVVGRRGVVHAVAVFGRCLQPSMGGRAAVVGGRGIAIHRDGRQRLNRKAQNQQHDNEELAPI